MIDKIVSQYTIVLPLLILVGFITWFVIRVKFKPVCPRCGSVVYVSRVRRNWLEKVILYPVKAVKLRCRRCWFRFFYAFPGDLSHIKKELAEESE